MDRPQQNVEKPGQDDVAERLDEIGREAEPEQAVVEP